jgi:hypothetical protein
MVRIDQPTTTLEGVFGGVPELERGAREPRGIEHRVVRDATERDASRARG